MTSRKLFAAGLLLAGLTVAGRVDAETRYVSDVLVINVREAPSDAAPTVDHLRTGDPMEVLETRDGFLKVRTEGGVEGWVAAQYTNAEIPKAVQIRRLEEEVARLRDQAVGLREAGDTSSAELEQVRADLGGQVRDLKRQLAETRTALDEATASRDEASRRYEQLREQAENVVEITAERDRLRTENRELAERAEALARAKAAATRTSAIRWFLAGAGVLLVGWLAGLSSRKKKSRFSVG